jgi:hypothetical protein
MERIGFAIGDSRSKFKGRANAGSFTAQLTAHFAQWAEVGHSFNGNFADILFRSANEIEMDV